MKIKSNRWRSPSAHCDTHEQSDKAGALDEDADETRLLLSLIIGNFVELAVDIMHHFQAYA